MKLRLVGCVVAASLLAACGSGASSYNPVTGSPAASAPLARPDGTAPTYAISIVLPENTRTDGLQPHASAAIGSLHAVTYVKARKYVFGVNNSTCTMELSGSTASGCGIFYTGSVGYTANKATFQFYSKSGGKGCLLAAATYKGALVPNSSVPVTFKAYNTKSCWK